MTMAKANMRIGMFAACIASPLFICAARHKGRTHCRLALIALPRTRAGNQTNNQTRARITRKPLNTTSRLAPTSAKIAIHSVASPITASARNTALMPSASTMF